MKSNLVLPNEKVSQVSLHNAAKTYSYSLLKTLLDEKADVNAFDNALSTPLLHAVQCDIIHKDRIRVIKALLEAKADPKLADSFGNTPLMILALEEVQSMEPLEMLLECSDLNVNAVTSCAEEEFEGVGNATALHMAIAREKPFSDQIIKKLLTRKDINLEIKDQDGITPLGVAFQLENPDAVDLLLEAKANLNRTGVPLSVLRLNKLYQEKCKNKIVPSKYEPILIKIEKIKDTLTLPFHDFKSGQFEEKEKHKECFASWLKVGAGIKYALYVEKINSKLKNLLEKNNALSQYQDALMMDDLPLFFDSFPDIYQFIAAELTKENSPLEQIHEDFWKGLKKPISTHSSTKNNGVAPDFKKWNLNPEYKSTMTTGKITLRIRNSIIEASEFTDFEMTPEEYNSTIITLNMKGTDTETIDTAPVALEKIKKHAEEIRKAKKPIDGHALPKANFFKPIRDMVNVGFHRASKFLA